MTEDLHSPTTAAPTPQTTPTVTAAQATTAHPAGTADTAQTTELPFGIPSDKPEILVGAAFAGGLVAALILKRLGSD